MWYGWLYSWSAFVIQNTFLCVAWSDNASVWLGGMMVSAVPWMKSSGFLQVVICCMVFLFAGGEMRM